RGGRRRDQILQDSARQEGRRTPRRGQRLVDEAPSGLYDRRRGEGEGRRVGQSGSVGAAGVPQSTNACVSLSSLLALAYVPVLMASANSNQPESRCSPR